MQLQRYSKYISFARTGGYLLAGLGFSVLAGWTFHINRLMTILPGQISMKANTALGFLFAGFAVVLIARISFAGKMRVYAALCSTAVLVIGLLELAEYLLNVNLHLDQLLFKDFVQYPFPGRMAHITALNFCLTGMGLLLISLWDTRVRAAQYLALLTGLSATLAIIGYLYGVPFLYGSVRYTSMALHTGVGFLILAGAILHCRPDDGIMRAITDSHGGAWLARRLLPIAVILPTLLGAVYVRTRFSLGDSYLSFACLTVFEIVLLVTLIWGLAFALNRLEHEKGIAQAALLRSEEMFARRYRTMFEDAVVGMFQSTPHGEFLNVNLALAQMLGYESPEEMKEKIDSIGNDLYVDPVRRDEFRRQMDEHGAVQNFECELFRRDGTKVWVSANVRFVQGDKSTARYEGTCSDVTRRRLLEAELVQSQKMEAVGRLAGGIAHDFNNAIGVVIGYSSLLKERVSEEKGALHYLEEISKAGHRAASLTRQLLAFSRKQVIRPSVVNLNSVVSDTEKMLRRLIGEDIEISVVLASDLGRIKADRGQLEQVLVNLAVNSRDAMPAGGNLVIETSNARLDAMAILQHPGAKPGDYVVLSISDTGCGMDKHVQSHIFEPFFTTKEPGKGTGLGLATVYGIVQQAEGHIWVYSEPGKGTRFKIFWPLTADLESKEISVDPARPPSGTETILLVEDDQVLRDLTYKCLHPFGYTILTTKDGESAIRISSEHQGPIHLLLTDVVMPGISGRQLAESLGALRPEIKVLYMSGYTADLIAQRGVLESNVDLLEKPFTQENLLRRVRKVLDGDLRAESAATGS